MLQMQIYEIKVSPTQSAVLQKLAFRAGYGWFQEREKNIKFTKHPYLVVRPNLKTLSFHHESAYFKYINAEPIELGLIAQFLLNGQSIQTRTQKLQCDNCYNFEYVKMTELHGMEKRCDKCGG